MIGSGYATGEEVSCRSIEALRCRHAQWLLDRSAVTHMSPRGRVTWTPDADAWSRSRLADFTSHVAAHGGPVLSDYEATLGWSLRESGAFWKAVSEWSGVRWYDEPSTSLAGDAMSCPERSGSPTAR